MILVSNL